MWYNIYFSQIEFLQKLFIENIDIYETYHAGGVMRILAKHPDGSWHTVWQTQNVSDLHSSRIFSPHFDVCIIHVKCNCSLFMNKSDNLCWHAIQILSYMSVIFSSVNFPFHINSTSNICFFFFLSQFGKHREALM